MDSSLRRFCGVSLPVLLLGLSGAVVAGQKAAVPVLKPAVPFVENDYGRALADAQKRNVKLFVDLWAPW